MRSRVSVTTSPSLRRPAAAAGARGWARKDDAPARQVPGQGPAGGLGPLQLFDRPLGRLRRRGGILRLGLGVQVGGALLQILQSEHQLFEAGTAFR